MSEMSEETVAFQSDGLRLDGLLTRPAGAGPFAAFVLLHGFGGHKDGPGNLESVQLLSSFGYAVLRFDFRGCGASEGPPGRTICLEQVEDVKNAVTWLSTQPGIDPKRIGVIGHSFGAAVAVYAAGVDPRIACAISSGGWGDGVKKFKKQHEDRKSTRLNSSH